MAPDPSVPIYSETIDGQLYRYNYNSDEYGLFTAWLIDVNGQPANTRFDSAAQKESIRRTVYIQQRGRSAQDNSRDEDDLPTGHATYETAVQLGASPA